MASLDPALSESVLALLQRISDEDGITVVTSLHVLDLARRYSRRVIGLRGGRVAYDGSPEGLTEAAARRIFADASDLMRRARWVGWAAIVGLFLWSAAATELSAGRLIEGFPYMLDFLRRMVPPDFSVLRHALTGAMQTFQIAVVGTGSPPSSRCRWASRRRAMSLPPGSSTVPAPC